MLFDLDFVVLFRVFLKIFYCCFRTAESLHVVIVGNTDIFRVAVAVYVPRNIT